VELEAGDAVLLHDWLLQRRDVNQTGVPRRALYAESLLEEKRRREELRIEAELKELLGA